MKKLSFLFAVAFLLVSPDAFSQSSSPDSARIVTSDIVKFWSAYDLFSSGMSHQDSLRILFESYLLNASPGLEDFIQARIGGAIPLLRTINNHSKFYASMREPTLQAVDFKGPMRQAFFALDSLYDRAVFPDVYLLIGRLNSGGTFSDQRILIGTEMHALSDHTDLSELSDWHRQVLKPIEKIPHIVAHELVHYQQEHRQHSRTLLAQSLMEGSADFIGELISGEHPNKHIHDWADPREEELWNEFKEKMSGTSYEGWLYGGTDVTERPADLGYWMGYRIVEYYVARSSDKREAIRKVIEIKEAEAFLEQSGYKDKFAK